MKTKFRDDLSENTRELLSQVSKTLCMNNLEIVEAGKGYILARTPVNDLSKNPHGNIHGGIIFTLMDTCAGTAASTLGYKVVTLNSSINFIKGLSNGHLYAKPEIIHHGRTTIVVNVDATDEEDNLIATGTFTMFVLEKIED